MAYTAVDEIPGIVAGLHETYKSGVTRCRSQNMLGLFVFFDGSQGWMMTQDVMIVPHLARDAAGTLQALTLGAGWHFYASGCQALSLSPYSPCLPASLSLLVFPW